NGRAHPFAAPRCGDGWEPLTSCRAQLLSLVQDVCPRLLEKWAPFFSQLDCVRQRDGARVVGHFTYYFQRRVFTASWLKIEAQCLGQSDLRDPIVILRSDQ